MQHLTKGASSAMKILVVEAEHKIARAVKKALEQKSYTVDVSYDGDDGYAKATTGQYDIVIVDRTIPGSYDGIKLVKGMRKEGIHTPVLFLSELVGNRDKTEGLNAGADDYLAKPFAIEELLGRVRTLLRHPSEQESTTLSIGDLTLDTLTYEVKRGDTLITLTSKEFSLLEFLLRNQGRPLSKDIIISHVWDYDADILPNTVEVYVKYLRNKVDAPFKTSLIQTVRGFGYKLEVR